MNKSQIIFFSIAIMWGVLFSRIPYISWKTISYVKKKYPRDWENESQGRIGTSIFGGKTVFQFFSKLNNPIIDNYKDKWNAALRQLLLSVLFSFIIVVVYILWVGEFFTRAPQV